MSDNEVRRFDAESWVCVHCRPNSDVVQVTSNLADEWCARSCAEAIEAMGGFVFTTCKAGVLVAATQLIRTKSNTPEPAAELVAKARFAISSLLGAEAVLVDVPGKSPNAKDCRQAADSLAAALDTYEQGGAK